METNVTNKPFTVFTPLVDLFYKLIYAWHSGIVENQQLKFNMKLVSQRVVSVEFQTQSYIAVCLLQIKKFYDMAWLNMIEDTEGVNSEYTD